MLRQQLFSLPQSSIYSKTTNQSQVRPMDGSLAKHLVENGQPLGTIFLEQLTKLKIYAAKQCSDLHTIKFHSKSGGSNMNLKQKQLKALFVELIKIKILKKTSIWPDSDKFINICSGYVFKKEWSGQWEKNYLFISKGGLIASKKKESQHCDLFLQEIKQIWTRFQLIEDCTYIVMKIKNKFWKYELAVPIEHSPKWIEAFCSLLKYQ